MGNKRSTSMSGTRRTTQSGGRPRTKRPERAMGDEKQRVKARLKWNEKCTIQDLRVTKVQGKKKEREVLHADVNAKFAIGHTKKKKSDLEVKMRAMNKLLASIRALKARHDAGEELDEGQLAKMGREDDVAAELQQFLAGVKA
jgi:uncharacterized protein with WD repeat